jgi:four helix bundle protein
MTKSDEPQPPATSKADDLQARTRKFAVQTVKFCRTIVTSVETQRIKSQLISASTSVGANYRAARRARSHAEFTAKIGVVAEEADESAYWLELAVELELGSPATCHNLYEESIELMKIFGKSSSTARGHRPDC